MTIRKAEEKGTTIGLLAKLHYGVTQFLDEAYDILYKATRECKDISSRFVVCVDIGQFSFFFFMNNKNFIKNEKYTIHVK